MYKDGLQSLRYDPILAGGQTSPQTKLENLMEMCLSKVCFIQNGFSFFTMIPDNSTFLFLCPTRSSMKN